MKKVADFVKSATREPSPCAELAATLKKHRALAAKTVEELEMATPILIAAIRHRSGQSRKVEAILWSVWNDSHPVALCDALSGLDTEIAVAALALIAARLYLAGDADYLLRKIIDDSGIQPAG
jgi:hypothetical protein